MSWASVCLLVGCALDASGPPERISAAPVAAAPQHFVEVVTGESHSCARDRSGAVFCWGRNIRGQVGDGTRTDRSSPVRVLGVRDAVSLSAADSWTCVARVDGSVWCWGSRAYDWPMPFEEGWRDADDIVPTEVVGLVGAVEVEARTGGDVCARDVFGEWRCLEGEHRAAACHIEDARVVCITPGCFDDDCWPGDYPIEGTEGATDVMGNGGAGCAVVDGEVRCWGEDLLGRTLPTEPAAFTVAGTRGAVTVATVRWRFAYTAHACATFEDGHVSCWGRDNHGELGIGVPRTIIEPRRVAGLYDVATIRGGLRHTCALDGEASLRCWGSNWRLQIGSPGLGTDVTEPRLIRLVVDHLAAGAAGTCVVVEGELSCTGITSWDNLGGRRPPYWAEWRSFELPEPIAWTAMAPWSLHEWGWSDNQACAGLVSGRVLCAGTRSLTPWRVGAMYEPPSLRGADRLGFGSRHVCGRVGGVWRCPWRFPDDYVPHVRAEALALLGDEPMCLILDGEVRCGDPEWDVAFWGVVPGVEDPVELFRTEHRGCALAGDGRLFCWGRSADGTLGTPEPIEREEARLVEGLPPVREVAMGARHTCALDLERRVWCWGYSGATGDGMQLGFRSAQLVDL